MEKIQEALNQVALEMASLKKEKNQQEKSSSDLFTKLQKESAGKIVLDVGGSIFTTSITTLCGEPNSMLAVMFSGRFNIPKDDKGVVFIDRDGEYFGNILHYLRTKNTPRIISDRELEHTLREAQYYQLDNFVSLLEKEREEDGDDQVKEEQVSAHKEYEVIPIGKKNGDEFDVKEYKFFQNMISGGWTPEMITGRSSGYLHALMSRPKKI